MAEGSIGKAFLLHILDELVLCEDSAQPEDDESTENIIWLTLLENLKPRTLRVVPKVYGFVENVIPLYNNTRFPTRLQNQKNNL